MATNLLNTFRISIEDYYRAHKRPLPWRKDDLFAWGAGARQLPGLDEDRRYGGAWVDSCRSAFQRGTIPAFSAGVSTG